MRQQTFFDDPELAAVPAGVMPKLNELQQDLFTRGRALYRDGVRRAIWQAPCGSGKTWLAAEQTKLALEKPDKVVLHIVHRRRLVDQMVSTLQRFGISACPIMDGRSSWTSRAYCASRDTLLSMVKNGIDLPRASLIIPDECHVAAKEVNDWYLSHCPDAYWTGYTATPIRPDGSSLNPPYQAMACMKPASHLIAAGRLCPVKVFNPDAVGQRRRKGEKVKPVGNPVDHWKKYANGLPTVVFASNKSTSREVCLAYNKAGIYAEHIDSDTDDEAREEVYERSRTGRTLVICNCGVLIEGVDLPWLVCCQILRGCNSLVLWIQAMGRIMRAFAGKLFGIGLDHAGAAHEFGMPDSDYVWTLDDETANVKANKPPKDRKPVTCPKCKAVFSNKPACPECGKVLPHKQRMGTMDLLKPGDGLLTEFTDGQQHDIQQDAFRRIWNDVLHMGRAKGWQMRQVAGAFRNRAKRWPSEAGIEGVPCGRGAWDVPVSEWMEQQQEAHAS